MAKRTRVGGAALAASLFCLGCAGEKGSDGRSAAASSPAPPTLTLRQARQGFQTHPVSPTWRGEPAPRPPKGVFSLVHYRSPVGSLAAYLTPRPRDGQRHAAIVWIVGGDANTLGDVWTPAPPDNDQTASAYRQAGIVMLFPSLRGGNDNPGRKEGHFGEVDDVLAAADFLTQQEFVDPQRIYLGGHSTGGTLALLVAEISPRFRAVFSFGPVGDASEHRRENVPFDVDNPREVELRAPIRWLPSIASPVFVFEGEREPTTIDAVLAMAKAPSSPFVHFHPIRNADHYSTLAPMNRLIARKILADTGEKTNLAFGEEELDIAAPAAATP